MKSGDVVEIIREELKEVCTTESYRYIEPLIGGGVDYGLFPLVSMEDLNTPSEHTDRGSEDSVSVVVMYALRSKPADVIDNLSTMEKKLKDQLNSNRTLDDNTKFFDIAVVSRDYTASAGLVLAWGEMNITCIVVD